MKTLFSISIFLLIAHGSSAQISADSVAAKPALQDSTPSDNGWICIRGCRSGYFYIDGVKVWMNEAPACVEDKPIVVSNPVKPCYYDTNGGIIRTEPKREEPKFRSSSNAESR